MVVAVVCDDDYLTTTGGQTDPQSMVTPVVSEHTTINYQPHH